MSTTNVLRNSFLRLGLVALAVFLASCGGGGGPGPTNEVSYTVSGLSANTTYYWEAISDDGKVGGQTESAIFSFTTQ